MAVAAIAGSILAGWAVEAGRYRPRRWVRASRWAVTQTDSGAAGSCGAGLSCPGRGRCGVRGWLIAGSSGLGEHEQVAVDAGADGRGAGGLVRAGGVWGAGVSWPPVMAACRATMCWA